MSSHWTSDFFTFIDSNGQQFVSAAAPFNVMVRVITRYKASGPTIPIGWPQPTAVADAAEWIAEKKRAGFRFAPVNA